VKKAEVVGRGLQDRGRWHVYVGTLGEKGRGREQGSTGQRERARLRGHISVKKAEVVGRGLQAEDAGTLRPQ